MATEGELDRLVREAKFHLVHREFDLATEKATRVIALDRRNVSAYLVRAEALRKLKRPDRALADVAVALRLDPNRPAPYVIRAEICKKRCQFDQAIADATQAILL